MGSALVVGVGASGGLGAALCRRFARAGLHVVVSGRSADKLEKVASEIRDAGGEATAVVADATVAAAVAAAFDAAAAAGGPPELVVYNAASTPFHPLLEIDDAVFEEIWRVCCFGGFLTGREAARRMLEAGGTLIFTGATASLKARPPFTAFASAKHGLRALAHGLAREFGPQGLHVAHVVIDGVIDGDRVREGFPQIIEQLGEDGALGLDALAEAYWMLHAHPRSAWTLELDLRPYKETF